MRVQGYDISLNHGAVVQLLDGELENFWYYTDQVGSASKSKKHGTRLKLPKTKEKQIVSIARLDWIDGYFERLITEQKPDYVGIEDYALDAKRGAHYSGEVGGNARLLMWRRGVPFRLHDPLSIKMFTAHDGTCQKDAIERAVKKRWGADFSKYNQPAPKPSKRVPEPFQNRRTSEDLADAYGIAQMIWTEVQLRSGHLLLRKLHQKEVRVFNRVTKSYPVSLLDREWLHNEKAGSPLFEAVFPESDLSPEEMSRVEEFVEEQRRTINNPIMRVKR